MTSAYYLSGNDCGIELFRYCDPGRFCPVCGCLRDPAFLPERITSRKRIKDDLAGTAEGVQIVSDDLRDFLRTFRGVRFVTIQSPSRGLNVLLSDALVPFDTTRRPVVFENLCAECGQFVDVYQALPVYLRPGAAVAPDGVYLTDLFSGYRHLRRQMLIVGVAVKDALVDAGFSGLNFDPVRNGSDA